MAVRLHNKLHVNLALEFCLLGLDRIFRLHPLAQPRIVKIPPHGLRRLSSKAGVDSHRQTEK
jgi:hypothetical protein